MPVLPSPSRELTDTASIVSTNPVTARTNASGAAARKSEPYKVRIMELAARPTIKAIGLPTNVVILTIVLRLSRVRSRVEVAWSSLTSGRSGMVTAAGTKETTRYNVEATLKSPASPNPKLRAKKEPWYSRAVRIAILEMISGTAYRSRPSALGACNARRKTNPSRDKLVRALPKISAKETTVVKPPPMAAPMSPNRRSEK